MAKDLLTLTMIRLRMLSEIPRGGALTDAELVERVIEQDDNAAFEVLVRRHAAMVLSVCRRVLRHEHDAEDAFQATFVVLFRKLRSVRQSESLGAWLHRVAFRVALRAQATQKHQRDTIPLVEERAAAVTMSDVPGELRALLDSEIDRLPAKLRRVAVLCLLEEQSYRAVADELGCPIGTVQSRLARARAHLQTRLTKQGITAAALGGMLAFHTSTDAAPALIQATLHATTTFPTMAGAVTILTQQTLRAMAAQQLGVFGVKCIASLAVLACFGWFGASLLDAAKHANADLIIVPIPDQVANGQPTREAELARDLARIEGEWQLVIGMEDGKPMPVDKIKATVLTFRPGNRVCLGCQRADDRFVILPSTPVSQIQLTTAHAEGESTKVGVYEFAGDSLRICLGTNEAPARDFTCVSGSGRTLWEFRRPGSPRNSSD